MDQPNMASGTTGPAPVTSATPAAPAASPATRIAVRRSSSQTADRTAANIGVAELRITEYDAGMYTAANANSTNGTAELTSPMTRNWRQ